MAGAASNSVAIQEVFRSTLNQDDLISAGTVVCTAAIPTRLGEYKVQAGQLIKMGFGDYASMTEAVGRIFADIKDNAATPLAVSGKLRFSIYSPQDRPMEILGEYDIDTINDNPTDRTKQQPLAGKDFPFISEDKKLVLELIAKTTVTVSKANSRILFDTTEAVV